MPTPTIKTKVAMDGEKEYKQALSEINSGLKVLSSEMKLTAEQFADNADGMEALTAKGDILERQILSQKEKIEKLKEALDHSANSFGEADKRTDSWKVSLNNAEADLVRMERALKDNREALEKAAKEAKEAEKAYDNMGDALDESGDAASDNVSILDKFKGALGSSEGGSKSLGDRLSELAGKLGIQLPEGATKAIDALGGVSGKTAGLTGLAIAAAKALLEIEKALISVTRDRASEAAGLANVAQTIGMNVEATQLWDYVLKTVGSSIQDAQGDLSAFQEKILEAKEGTGEAAEMFWQLGVSVVDQNGNLRGTEEVLLDTVHALQIMRDITERNAISSTLLGSTGEKLIPIYNQSAESLEHLFNAKRELGIMTGDEIEALKRVSAEMINYEEQVNHAKDTIAAEFAPAYAAFLDAMSDGLGNLGESAESSGLINFFGTLLELVTALTPVLDVLGYTLEALEPVFDAAAIALGILADALGVVVDIWAAWEALKSWDLDGAWDHLSDFAGRFTGGKESATKRAWNNAFNASGDWNFDGGLTWVGENGPELAYLPQGSRIFSAQESRSMAGGDVFYVTIDAKNVQDFVDVVTLAKAQRRIARQNGGVKGAYTQNLL